MLPCNRINVLHARYNNELLPGMNSQGGATPMEAKWITLDLGKVYYNQTKLKGGMCLPLHTYTCNINYLVDNLSIFQLSIFQLLIVGVITPNILFLLPHGLSNTCLHICLQVVGIIEKKHNRLAYGRVEKIPSNTTFAQLLPFDRRIPKVDIHIKSSALLRGETESCQIRIF